MAGSSILHLNESNFLSTIENSNIPVLVDFWAEWCMPCRALAPVLDELSKEYEGKICFAKINVDECQNVAAQYGIRGIPTLILFKKGKKVTELIGNQPKEKIKSVLNESVSSS